MNHKLGNQTVRFGISPYIISRASVVGAKEGEGPLKSTFDMVVSDDKMGQKSWDLAEGAFQKTAVEIALKKANLKNTDIEYILSGDLQNQCAATHYGLRETNIPFLGLYGACSTMVESLSVGSMIICGGYASRVVCLTSSHFCSAEKQYRNPLEYGGQRTPTAQWTATASGAAVVAKNGNGPRITHITTGKIVDKGITDVSNMGAAMAPAALDTITAHFKDTGRTPDDYDLILTGDLGVTGSEILCELIKKEGFDITGKHNDCGKMLYDIDEQDVHAGGSGCGCCASVLCGHILNELEKGTYKNILVAATGALMNPLTVLQGESIPTISHAVSITI
ncbi:MAG: stage V sporulation protein AD [Clostridia bacterium]|nr:stage V sporulation protein AD [Clostridia bacterium]